MPDDSTRARGCAVLEMLRSGGVSALRRSSSELQASERLQNQSALERWRFLHPGLFLLTSFPRK